MSHYCIECNYTTNTAVKLQCHHRIHVTHKYACTTCDYTTYNSGNLRVHIRTHTGEKPFACTTCDYRAAQKGTLVLHQRTHAERPPLRRTLHYCELCDYATVYAPRLRKHAELHVQHLTCPQCEVVLATVIQLQLHLQCHLIEQVTA